MLNINNIDSNEQNMLKIFLNSLSSDLNKQKKLICNLKDLINQSSSGNIHSILMLKNINKILPNIIIELGIPFCDLIYENKEIINYYINIFLKSNNKEIKNILINFITVFNFQSIEENPADDLIGKLQCYDNEIKQLMDNKRVNKTEIEDLYDTLSAFNKNIDNIKEVKKILQEKSDKLNKMEMKNIYFKATIEFLREKINKMEDLINTRKDAKMNGNNLIFNNNNNLFNNLNINKYNDINNQNGFNNFFNYNFNNISTFPNYNSNCLNKEELTKLKEIPLKDREFFYRDEELSEGEDEYIEFKNYTYPFTQEKIDEIKRQYCGFLNSQGGRIYIGINDLKIVKGILLDYKTRDTIRNELINYTYDFYPKCRLNKINVYFIPIKSMQNKNIIPNLYVIKIIILPGDIYNLYSITNKGGYISAIRLPGQCINLTAEEIHDEIIRRSELLKKSYIDDMNQKKEIKCEEEINEEKTNEESNINENIIEKSEDDNNKKKGKVIYVVHVSNIDKSLNIKDINKFFNGYGRYHQKFPEKEGKSVGYGEMHFLKKETAKSFIQKFNKINLCGKKQINMILKKRRIFN